jgi:ribosomal protein L37E
MDLEIASVHDACDALMERGADKPPCPACGKAIWNVIEKPIAFRDIGRESFRTIALSCDHCGYLRFHVATSLLS